MTTTEGIPIDSSSGDEPLCNDVPCPRCPKCYSSTIERMIWDKFKPKKIIQCEVCKFYWVL
ncbi:MAG: hypothetical protein JW776_00245 [Candidatus Lokiarchaeota archaeon]|nr:hypothetical protein [Candidatus Lokiarchaeota archaeon]